jgi:hypothetical protein|tara:strand:- start:431 stop:880 length:450 start_codon:yes stop_codon:yes gene_type:complete
MIKKAFLYMLLLTLVACGYEPMLLNKNNLNNIIQSFQLEGNKKINKKIISSLNLKKQNKKTGYNLIIKSNKVIETVSRDANGNIAVYKTKISVLVTLLNDDKIFKEKLFNVDFTYNDLENKFDLSQYQKDIELNLINEITENIVVFLNI